MAKWCFDITAIISDLDITSDVYTRLNKSSTFADFERENNRENLQRATLLYSVFDSYFNSVEILDRADLLKLAPICNMDEGNISIVDNVIYISGLTKTRKTYADNQKILEYKHKITRYIYYPAFKSKYTDEIKDAIERMGHFDLMGDYEVIKCVELRSRYTPRWLLLGTYEYRYIVLNGYGEITTFRRSRLLEKVDKIINVQSYDIEQDEVKLLYDCDSEFITDRKSRVHDIPLRLQVDIDGEAMYSPLFNYDVGRNGMVIPRDDDYHGVMIRNISTVKLEPSSKVQGFV